MPNNNKGSLVVRSLLRRLKTYGIPSWITSFVIPSKVIRYEGIRTDGPNGPYELIEGMNEIRFDILFAPFVKVMIKWRKNNHELRSDLLVA